MMHPDTLVPTLSDRWMTVQPPAALLQQPLVVSRSACIEPLDPIDLFVAETSGAPRVLWLAPATAEAIVGLQCRPLPVRAASTHPLTGLEAIARGWDSVRRQALQDGPLAPLAFVGTAFEPRTPRLDQWWRPFGPRRLLFPTVLYVQRGTVAARAEQSVVRPGQRTSPLLSSWPFTRPALDGHADPAPVTVRDLTSRHEWARMVERARAALRTGTLQKVVLARAVELEASRPFAIAKALRTLLERYPRCIVFAVGIGETVFLGATPERLARVDGETVTTIALAGSAPRSPDPDEDSRVATQLLASEKDRHEHAFVVEAIRSALAPLCEHLAVPDTPQVVSIANVHHLATPIAGRLSAPYGVLDVVARLHPTPAVGGTPRAAALAFIREHETVPRGWYAGALGWVSASGAGDFVVALRSGIVRNSSARLYAGCGIVAESDPAVEWEESEAKLRPMLEALGGR